MERPELPRVLTIEDDATTAEEIARELGARGYRVDCIGDGAAGLAQAQAQAYDVITLDRMLPGLDGLQVAQALKVAGVQTPILMISALDDVDERVRGLRAGGDDYLTKPFALEEMAARVEVLLRRAQAPAGPWCCVTATWSWTWSPMWRAGAGATCASSLRS
jgi:two-component system, OmpR family, response regulator